MNVSRFSRMAVVASLIVPSASAMAMVIRHDVNDSQYTTFGQGSAFDAVGRVVSGGSGGTGTLVASNWVLTASHVVDNGATNAQRSFTVGGNTFGVAETVILNNSWSLSNGLDLALMRLTSVVNGINPLGFYRANDVVGQEGTAVGFGASGNGNTGFTFSDGQRRGGNNMIDASGIAGSASSVYWADFDSGSSNDNGLGSTTRSALEFNLAPGDSGGPLFINNGGMWQIAGVASFIASSDGNTNGDYGDFSGWHGTFAHQDWIDNTAGVPEPATMTILGLGALAALRRKKSQK